MARPLLDFTFIMLSNVNYAQYGRDPRTSEDYIRTNIVWLDSTDLIEEDDYLTYTFKIGGGVY